MIMELLALIHLKKYIDIHYSIDTVENEYWNCLK